MNLNGVVGFFTNLQATNPGDLGANPDAGIQRTVAYPLTNGNGADQANFLNATRQFTLAASGTVTHDLNALLDAFGVAGVATKAKALIIENDSTSPGTITVGNAASNQFQGPLGAVTNTLVLDPKTTIAIFNPGTGWTISPTADQLKVVAAATAGTYTYRITLVAAI